MKKIPSSIRDDAGDFVRHMYSLLLEEFETEKYSAPERALLEDPTNYYGRYLNPPTRRYMLHSLERNIGTAIEYLDLNTEGSSDLIVMDLGCGLGMQSFIFAALGARVVGFDLDERCIALCQRRKLYFERRLDQSLDVRFEQANFAELDSDSVPERFDRFFSMSAFSQIPPLADSVDRTSRLLRDNSKVFLWDINPSYLFLDTVSEWRASFPNPSEIAKEFALKGFRKERLEGATGLPHQIWNLLPGHSLAHGLDAVLRTTMRFSFNYHFGARRIADSA